MTGLHATFASLRNRNYRLYFTGQLISVSGTWMQKLGQAWLVLELTGSGTLLGITAALQHLPTLVAGPFGGLLADRLDKRRTLLWTQSVSGLLALILAVLTATGTIQVWMVMVLAFSLGSVNALDKPTRHTFVMEMVGPRQLTNAVTLNSVVIHTGMLIGPTIAGLTISWLGIAYSFLLNGLSYVAVVVALTQMRTDQLIEVQPVARARGQVRAGISYVRRTPVLLGPLLLMAVVGMLAFEWQVTLPLLAVDAFGGDADTLGLMFSAMGMGAIIGGLGVATSATSTPRSVVITGFLFASILTLTAVAPTLPIALVGLVFVGGTSIALRALASSLLQLLAEDGMRGRVIALFAVATSGVRPIGAPIIGWVGENLGPRMAFGLGGVGALIATAAATLYLWRRGGMSRAVDEAPDPLTSIANTRHHPLRHSLPEAETRMTE